LPYPREQPPLQTDFILSPPSDNQAARGGMCQGVALPGASARPRRQCQAISERRGVHNSPKSGTSIGTSVRRSAHKPLRLRPFGAVFTVSQAGRRRFESDRPLFDMMRHSAAICVHHSTYSNPARKPLIAACASLCLRRARFPEIWYKRWYKKTPAISAYRLGSLRSAGNTSNALAVSPAGLHARSRCQRVALCGASA